MKFFLLLFIKFCLLPIYYLSYLIPRNKKRWVFGEANGFNNNSKYFYLEVLNTHKEIDAVWIGNKEIVKTLRNKNLPCHYKFSLKGLWYSLTSKVYIVSSTPGDINFYTSGGARIVNLWHGVGIKACLWSNPIHQKYRSLGFYDNFLHYVNCPHLYHKPDLVLSTSDDMIDAFFAPMFDVERAKCIASLYPRCRFMMQDRQKIIEHIEKYESEEYLDMIRIFLKYKKVIMYAPTFRDSGADFISQSGIDFGDLNNFLVSRNYLFVLKLHPATNYNPQDIRNFSNILYLEKSLDSYLVMPFCDMLISDYSSIVYDYMLLEKQVEIFAFDFKQYKASCRDIVFSMEEVINTFSFSDNYIDLKKNIEKEKSIVPDEVLHHWWTKEYYLYKAVNKLIDEK